MPELLLELLSEEIPARMQARAADDLLRLVTAGLTGAGLTHDRAEAFVTPRRLAIVVDGVPEEQPSVSEERRGPRADATEAAINGFLRGAGVGRDMVEERDTPKGRFLFVTIMRTGRLTAEVLVEVVGGAITKLSWPKSMRWGEETIRWVRPLQSILCLFDGSVVPVRLGKLEASKESRGHRFLAPEPVTVENFADYEAKLRAGHVILDREARKQRIAEQARALAMTESLTVHTDADLMEEVAGLVEWPVVRMGCIDDAFMDVPPEVLTTAMRSHQKYFRLDDANGHIAPRFLVVANTEGSDGGHAIVAGNERVLRARLADARFFWDVDRSATLESRVPRLGERIFHARLGTDLQRTERLDALARTLAPFVQANPELAGRAARLAKADLTTGMVGEFPELQGVMGRYYAIHDGEHPAVAEAIGQHYAPQGPADRSPSQPIAVAVAVADKLDTLTGFFGIGEIPTGSGDPFALRRSALGVIRLIVENRLRIGLRSALRVAADGFRQQNVADMAEDAVLIRQLLDFFIDRLKVHLRGQGVRHDLIAAVVAEGLENDILRLLARVKALEDFLGTDDGANVLIAYKRASNIVRIEEKKDRTSYDGRAEPGLLAQPEETELFRALEDAHGRIGQHVHDEQFGAAMAVVAGLRGPVDAFFDRVTVNCEETSVRANRLRLLAQIRSALLGVADFSLIEG